jgi:uncharacterized protein YecE (DUF72 family)
MTSAMNLYAGTSGFSYKAWKGPFYPEELTAKDMLGYYGSQLPAVEINNTFYQLPKAAVLEGWAAQSPMISGSRSRRRGASPTSSG